MVKELGLADELQERLIKFAVRVIKLADALPATARLNSSKSSQPKNWFPAFAGMTEMIFPRWVLTNNSYLHRNNGQG